MINTDLLVLEKQENESVRRLIGRVILRQDTALMYADSAHHFENSNRLLAWGNVRLETQDSMKLRADKLDYDGKTKIARLYNNIVFKHKYNTLITNDLTFFRVAGLAVYQNYGKLQDTAHTLQSRSCTYYTTPREAFFKHNVKLTHKDYVMDTDSLWWNHKTKTARFVSPTRIYSNDSAFLYTEGGTLNTRQKQALLYQNPYYIDSNYSLTADTLFINDSLGWGWGRCSVRIQTTDSTLYISGDYSELNKKTKSAFITQNAFALAFDKSDTMEVFADTLFAFNDPKTPKKQLHAYHHASITLKQIQAVADSVVYDRQDSVLKLFGKPVVWSGQNQINGDTLRLYFRNRQPDSLYLAGNTFMITREDSTFFNQIRGKITTARFENNQISKLNVTGNAESLYFIRDGLFIAGMNRSVSKSILMLLEQNKPQTIKLYKGVQSTFYPIHELFDTETTLPGFNWRDNERPQRYLIR